MLTVRGAAQTIVDRAAETFVGNFLRHDQIELRVIELAQLPKQIRGGFAQIALRTQHSHFRKLI